MLATCKIFDKICLKAIYYSFYYMIKRGTGELNFWVGLISNRRGKFLFWACRKTHTHTCARTCKQTHTHTHTQTRTHTQTHARTHAIPSLVEHVGLRLRKTLIRVLGLLIIMILMRVRKSIFFQSNTFTG